MAWLRFLPHAGIAIIAVALTWQLASMWHGGTIDRLNREHHVALTKAVIDEQAACAKDKATTKEVSDALQKQLQSVNARHADAVHRLLKHEAAKCARPADAAGRHDAAAGGDGLHRPDAADSVAALGLAAAAERQTQQLIACQDFVKRIAR